MFFRVRPFPAVFIILILHRMNWVQEYEVYHIDYVRYWFDVKYVLICMYIDPRSPASS